MELFEAIAKRKSYRGSFAETAVGRADLQKIVQAGLLAPSGKNAQTTRFVIVDDADLLAKIGQMAGASKALREAKAMIACVVDREPEAIYEGHSFAVEDCAAAVENMLLAVTALGYATVWIDGWLRLEGRAAEIGALLGVPAEKVVRVLLPIGVPAQDSRQPTKMPFEERAWFNEYGQKA